MRQNDLHSLAEQLIPIARDAGRAIMDIYQGGPVAVRSKADDSPVTAADLAAHRCLFTALQNVAGLTLPVVSEEDGASQSHRTTQERFWLIDPLDGTKEFIARNGEFTVNIALIDRGQSILGVVYAPAIDALYWGGPELGAWRLHGRSTEAIHVTAATDGPTRVVASKSHLNEETAAFIARLGPTSLVQAGSSLKFCRIAEGAADIYPRMAPTCEWDTAAAQAVLEGAGGYVLDLNGIPLRYGKPEVLNPSFIATRDVSLVVQKSAPEWS
jgi:3'(2'), 5'-bisphosphate nucleotidase